MTNTQPSNTESDPQNLQAAGFMLVAVLLYSVVPVFAIWGEWHQAPFMYNAVRLMFAGIGTCIFLIVFHRPQLFDHEIWRGILRNWRRWSLLGVILGLFDYAVFAWSLKYIDISVASVLLETWPLWMILLTSKIFQSEKRYENINLFGWACMLMGFAGLAFVISSHSSIHTDDVGLGKEDTLWLDIFWGALLALIAAIMSAIFTACTLRWGTIVLGDIPDHKHKQKETDEKLTVFFILIATVIASVPNVIFSVVLSVSNEHNEMVEVDNMLIAAAVGLFISVPARISLHMANLTTHKLEINAIGYATPIFTLVCLAILGYINVAETNWLVIGAMGVIAANTSLNFQAERRFAYQSLVVSLWVCGVVVYFRSFFHAPVFYETVAVVTTMFILILSFRVDRLVRRTSDEDELTLEIWRKISLLPKCLQDRLRKIDEAKNPKELSDAHNDFHDSLEKECADKKEFSDIMEQTNILAHSKQQGDNFSEYVVLSILGGISIGGLWFFMPEEIIYPKSGAGGFFLEMVAFLITATVFFLLSNIRDLQQDRNRQMLRTKSDTKNPDEKNKREGLVFREYQDRTAARRISIVVCVGIVATFGVLFWLKWMPIYPPVIQ